MPREKIAADDPEVRVGYARIRILPVDVVERIEEVGDELDLLPLIRTESEDLVHPQIPVLVSGTVNLSHTSIAETKTLGLSKATGIEPFRIGVRVVWPWQT